MSTQPTHENSPAVVDLLESAQSDLEQFRKDLGHDQAGVHMKYDQLKGEIKDALRQMKEMVRDNKALAKDVADALRVKLSQLEEHLAAPHKEGDGELLNQLTIIKRMMEDIAKYLAKIDFFDLSLSRITDRIYRYKIKLGIVKLKFQLGTMQMKDTVLDVKYDLKGKIHELREYLNRSEDGLEKRWHLFHHEISEAYEHLQKAFTAK